MLRIIHNQTVHGAILLVDVDDGLPNKTAHRLGFSGDPKATTRDGYSDKPKQSCYVPRTMAAVSLPLVKGYIDLKETDRVKLSAANGCIAKMATAGFITVVSFTAADLSTPTISSAVFSTNLTITGTGFLSVSPNQSLVTITGTGAGTVTPVNFGTFTDTSIVILAAHLPVGFALATSSVRVTADGHNSNVQVVA